MMLNWRRMGRREVICTECLRKAALTNGYVFLVMAAIALLLLVPLRSPALIAGVAIITTGAIIYEFIVALRWHRHD